jgi:hypothetical protein
MKKFVSFVQQLWYAVFPKKKDGYFYRLQKDGELAQISMDDTKQAPVLVEDVPDDYLSANYEEDLIQGECPYNLSALKLLHKKDLEALALDCGILINNKPKKAQLVKELADYYGI